MPPSLDRPYISHAIRHLDVIPKMSELVDVKLSDVKTLKMLVNIIKMRIDVRCILAGNTRVPLKVQTTRRLTMLHLVIVIAFT